jgi:Ca-activated chloride channel family protein
MVRLLATLALVLAVVGAAHATGAARVMGMYPAAAGGAQTPAPLPMFESKLSVTVRGPIVETVVTQKFVNRADHAIEATYIFPLPYDAAVSAMSITTGTRTIHAAIEKREEAQRRYEAAISAGVAAAVTDQERPDVFTQTVAAIPAKGTVEIVLRYDSLARYADGTWQLVLPMVVAPRFVPGAVSGRPTTGTGRAPDTDRAPDASRVTPTTGPQAGGATLVEIHFGQPVSDVTSPTHELVQSSPAIVSFTDGASDHDAVVRWKASVPAAGWVEQGARGGFAAVIVEAPAAPAKKGAQRVMIVLDRAATMRGDANMVAQPMVRALFAAMGTTDRAAVIGSDRVGWSAPGDALRAIEQAWTKPHAPLDLTRVLQSAKSDGAPLLLVSDGLVADDAAAIAAAKQLGVPVHVIGVGPAPGRALLTQIAAVTGGTVRFVLPSDDLAAIAKASLLDIASPPQPLMVNWGTLAASDVVPGVLPRLGAGQAILVVARVKKAQTANVRARGELFAIEALPKSSAIPGATTPAGPLARRWARTRLDELLVGTPDAVAVTKHALEFGLVSPYTSLVAIGTDVVVQGGTKHSVAVPVSVPSGMHWSDVKNETSLDIDATSVRGRDESLNDKKTKPKTKDDEQETQVSGGGEAAPDSDGADEDDSAPKRVSVMDAPMSESVQLTAAMPGSITVADRSVLGRNWRASLGVGGGLLNQDSTNRGLIATTLRIELGLRRSLVGVEGALWLVDGFHGQGHVLASYSRLGLTRWLELGLGLGLHFGDGIGPAGAISLRLHLPPAPWASAYLRYDGALLTQPDSSRQGQNTGSLGVEWGF